MVLLNAAAALVVAGRADDLGSGLGVAEGALRDGAGLDVLQRWVERSSRVRVGRVLTAIVPAGNEHALGALSPGSL